jgi:hypothetical protein
VKRILEVVSRCVRFQVRVAAYVKFAAGCVLCCCTILLGRVLSTFKGACSLQHQCDSIIIALMMETASTFQTPINFTKLHARQSNPQDDLLCTGLSKTEFCSRISRFQICALSGTGKDPAFCSQHYNKTIKNFFCMLIQLIRLLVTMLML